MKIYAIADKTHECYGHGDYGTEERIVRQDPWGKNQYYPCFIIKEEAQKFLDKIGYPQNGNNSIVELDLFGSVE